MTFVVVAVVFLPSAVVVVAVVFIGLPGLVMRLSYDLIIIIVHAVFATRSLCDAFPSFAPGVE